MPDKRIVFHNPERRPQHMRNQTQGLPIGWCNHNKHRGKLSLRQMKQHKCLGKNCPFLVRNEKHDYWVRRDQDRQEKKEKKRRARLENYIKEEIRASLDKILPNLYHRNR